MDSQTKLIHAVVATPANVIFLFKLYDHDSACLPELLHGEETREWGDSAYHGQSEVIREHAPKAKDFAHRRYRYKDTVNEEERAKNKTKSSVRAKVEHPFLIIKRIFGFARYKGLAKNAHRLCACELVHVAPVGVATGRGVVCLQYAKRGENGPLNDEKQASRPHFRPKWKHMCVAQPFLVTCSSDEPGKAERRRRARDSRGAALSHCASLRASFGEVAQVSAGRSRQKESLAASPRVRGGLGCPVAHPEGRGAIGSLAVSLKENRLALEVAPLKVSKKSQALRPMTKEAFGHFRLGYLSLQSHKMSGVPLVSRTRKTLLVASTTEPLPMHSAWSGGSIEIWLASR